MACVARSPPCASSAAAGEKSNTGFKKPRAYRVSFTESATAAVPQKKSAFGAVREKKRASAAVLRKKPLAPAESGEELDDVASKAEVKFDELSLVTLNVDGLGEYATAPAARMEAILDEVLVVKPDVLLLQEMTFAMFTQLRRRLPEWKVCRKKGALGRLLQRDPHETWCR